MNTRALELIPDYVLGTLSEAETREVEAAIAASPELQKEAEEIREAFGLLPASLPMPAPSPDLKKRLLHAAMHEERLMPFAPALSKYFDLTVERVREILRWVDDKTHEWIDGPAPGMFVLDFDGGPRVAHCDVGLIRMPANLHFPWHRHYGLEIQFVLEGEIRDFDGRIFRPGEAIEKLPGTEHEFFTGDREVLVGVVIQDGIEICDKPE